MTFFLDNDIPDALARVLTQAGHEAERLRDLLPRNADDLSVLQFAQDRKAVLITCNRDHFLSLAKNHPHAGIIVLIRRQSRMAECGRFLKLLKAAGEMGIRNNINFA